MAEWNIGPKNGMWTGGRSLASNGYILIRVGESHHLADVRGYAYEHRLIAEIKIGRRLLPNEQVHHVDEDKQNNRPENLLVTKNPAHHRLYHRKGGCKNRLPDEPNPSIQCACGCGITFDKYDQFGRPRLYISGHNPPASSPTIDKIMDMLRSGLTTRKEMLEVSKFTTPTLAIALSKLSKRGAITSLGHGRYELPKGSSC